MSKKVKYLVKNSNGGVLAGCVTKEQAEEKKAKWDKEFASDPSWYGNIEVYIEERN